MTGATRSTSRAGYGAGTFALVLTLIAALSGSEAFGDATVLGGAAPDMGAGPTYSANSDVLSLQIPEDVQRTIAEVAQAEAASRASILDHTGAGMIYAPNLYGIGPVQTEEEQLAANRVFQQQNDMAGDPLWQLERLKDKSQVGFVQNVTDGFGETVIASLYEFFSGEGAAGGFSQIGHGVGAWLFGIVGLDFGVSNFDKQAHADELLKDVPLGYWDSIMQYDDLGAAQRARGRILADLERQERMSLQRGGGPAFASFIGKSPDYLLAALGIFLGLLFMSRKKDTRFPHLDRADW